MRTNENAVRFQLEHMNSVPFKRRQKLHDKNWDVSLCDNHKVKKMTTQELAKKLVFRETHIDECGRAYTIYKWHFDNSNSWDYGKQGITKACEYLIFIINVIRLNILFRYSIHHIFMFIKGNKWVNI